MEWTAQRKSEVQAEDKGEPEEAAAEIEAGGRRKEIADGKKASTEMARLRKEVIYVGNGATP